MTMPTERMRALRLGWELLAAIRQDDVTPETFKRRVELVAWRYPTPDRLVELIRSGAERLSNDLAEAIDEGGVLFEELQRTGLANSETLRFAVATLRHYPLRGTALDQARHGTLGGLRCWLDVEE